MPYRSHELMASITTQTTRKHHRLSIHSIPRPGLLVPSLDNIAAANSSIFHAVSNQIASVTSWPHLKMTVYARHAMRTSFQI